RVPGEGVSRSASVASEASASAARSRRYRSIWRERVTAASRQPGSATGLELRVVDRLLGVEGERRLGGGVLERVTGRERQLNLEAERLVRARGERAVAGVRALRDRAERAAGEHSGAVQHRAVL